eukprot:3215153-Rhodomonas_salina.1
MGGSSAAVSGRPSDDSHCEHKRERARTKADLETEALLKGHGLGTLSVDSSAAAGGSPDKWRKR